MKENKQTTYKIYLQEMYTACGSTGSVFNIRTDSKILRSFTASFTEFRSF